MSSRKRHFAIINKTENPAWWTTSWNTRMSCNTASSAQQQAKIANASNPLAGKMAMTGNSAQSSPQQALQCLEIAESRFDLLQANMKEIKVHLEAQKSAITQNNKTLSIQFFLLQQLEDALRLRTPPGAPSPAIIAAQMQSSMTDFTGIMFAPFAGPVPNTSRTTGNTVYPSRS